MSTPQAVRAAIAALLVLLLGASGASAAPDHVVITGGAVVPAGQTAGDIVVLDGTVNIAGRATGDVVGEAPALDGPMLRGAACCNSTGTGRRLRAGVRRRRSTPDASAST
jgi:hypothetical protein